MHDGEQQRKNGRYVYIVFFVVYLLLFILRKNLSMGRGELIFYGILLILGAFLLCINKSTTKIQGIIFGVLLQLAVCCFGFLHQNIGTITGISLAAVCLTALYYDTTIIWMQLGFVSFAYIAIGIFDKDILLGGVSG